jgi:hypothetical protein
MATPAANLDTATDDAMASHERVVTTEVVWQQELAPTSREHAAAVAHQEKAYVAALKLQLTALATPPPHPTEVAVPAPPLPDVDDTFEASTITYFHAQAADVQDIRSLVPWFPSSSMFPPTTTAGAT